MGLGGDFKSSEGIRLADPVGLQSLVHFSHLKCNVVQQASLRSHRINNNNMDSPSRCYLKSCYLCNKKLSLDKDVYMYRGDQGFCSIECRDRQMYLDETKEIEALSKRRRQCKSQWSETRVLLEEMRHRRVSLVQKRCPMLCYHCST